MLEESLAAVAERAEIARRELDEDRRAGEGVAAELRACAAGEAQIQQRLREQGEAVTAAEVRAQQARDQEHDASSELGGARRASRARARAGERAARR